MTANGGSPVEAPGFFRSMPRPLMALFVLLGLFAIVSTLVLIARPPLQQSIAVEDRRPPPRATLSHDTGRLVPGPAPSPSAQASLPPRCDAVSSTRVVGFGGAVGRLDRVFMRLCSIAGRGAGALIPEAMKGLAGTTVRFAVFERTGVESTVDFATRTIWLNAKLSNNRLQYLSAVPVIVHEAFHLAHADAPVDARQELLARRAEWDACRLLIRPRDLPRWCKDARTLAELPDATAIARLVAAGYAPER